MSKVYVRPHTRRKPTYQFLGEKEALKVGLPKEVKASSKQELIEKLKNQIKKKYRNAEIKVYDFDEYEDKLEDLKEIGIRLLPRYASYVEKSKKTPKKLYELRVAVEDFGDRPVVYIQEPLVDKVDKKKLQRYKQHVKELEENKGFDYYRTY